MRGQRVPERGVGGDGGVPDPVDRRDRVPDRDGVQPPPLTLGEDTGVDLQMQMAMRVSGAGGMVPHRHRLQHLDRGRDLLTAGPDASGGVLPEPADDLLRGTVLRRVVGGGHIGVQFRGQGPGLRAVHRHLHEPHRARVVPQAAPRLSSVGVDAGDPRLVRVAIHPGQLDNVPVGVDGVPLGEGLRLGEVVVLHPRAVLVQVFAGASRVPAVDLYPAVHNQ